MFDALYQVTQITFYKGGSRRGGKSSSPVDDNDGCRLHSGLGRKLMKGLQGLKKEKRAIDAFRLLRNRS